MKAKWKKGLVAGLAFLMALALFGCGSGGSKDDKTAKTDSTQEKTPTVGLVVSTQDNPFFVDLMEGAKAEAEGMKVNFTFLDSQNDSTKEMSNMEDMINQKVDVILLNPVDSDAAGASVQAANDAKIPVITLDRSASTGDVVSHIASDNVAGGKMAGEYILQQLNNTGKVVELEGVPGTSAARDRGQGFEAAVKDKLDIVAKQTANFDRAQGMSVMEDILQAQSKIDAVFAQNDEMALGASEAIKASNRKILVVGFDATDDAKAAIKSGDMGATVQQLPKEIGSEGVDTAIKVTKGEKVDASIPVKLELVTKDNVDK